MEKIRCVQANRASSDRQRGGLPPSEHEVLFSRRAVVETLMWSFMIVEVEIGGQPSVQLTYSVILAEIDVFIFDAAPETFAEDVSRARPSMLT